MPKGFSPKKGKILPSACHYSPWNAMPPPTTTTKIKTLCPCDARCLEGVFRLDQELTKKNHLHRPRLLQSKNTRVEIYVYLCWVRVCAHVFILDAGEDDQRTEELARINFVTGLRKWIRDSDQGCTPRFPLDQRYLTSHDPCGAV